MVILSGNKLIAARDPFGFKPLCMGMLGSSVVFASESCAFDAIGAQFIRDIEPGEIVVAENGSIISTLRSDRQTESSLCVFEFIYFARPDSVIDGLSVERVRQEFGRFLAMRDTVKADIVIGVPDSGLSAALGYSKQAGLPYGVGLVKNRYIGSDFYTEHPVGEGEVREHQAQCPSAEVKGSALSWSTIRSYAVRPAHIVSILRQAGASEVHMRVSSPPFLNRCYYGTDIPSEKSLPPITERSGNC